MDVRFANLHLACFDFDETLLGATHEIYELVIHNFDQLLVGLHALKDLFTQSALFDLRNETAHNRQTDLRRSTVSTHKQKL